MKKNFTPARRLTLSIVFMSLLAGSALAQRNCGQSHVFAQMAKDNPAQYQQMREQHRAKMEAFAAAEASGGSAKTAAQYAIPVVFHFVVSSTQYTQLGGDTGIKRRVASQLKVLNADYNRHNADSILIPSAFKPRYTSVGIQYAIAKATNSATIAPGIEVKIVTGNPVYNDNDLAVNAKQNTATGLAAWDQTKYLNVWVVRITSSGAGTVLGVCTPPAFVGYNVGGHTVAANEIGVVLNFGAVGSREFTGQYFISGIDKGRTLTHEVGHFFELYHTWGDDDNADTASHCPGEMSGSQQVGYDDNVNDTPPQAKRTYCDFPNHGGTNCPTFPLLDKCSPASPGIMYMNYMDYVNDAAMQMFTIEQAARMNNYLTTETWSLTQNPTLSSVAVAEVAPLGRATLSPNPANGAVHIALDNAAGFKGATIVNLIGQPIANIIPQSGARAYDINLSNAPRGIYMVRFSYEGGNFTQKLILE